MAKNTYKELIESYLENKMNEVELAEFENQLMHDPLLKSELDFQKDIINSIKNYRKAEIKARLNHIKVGPSPAYFNLLKIAASVSVTSLLVWGGYNYFQTEEDPEIARVEIAFDNALTSQSQPLPDIPEPLYEAPEQQPLQMDDAQVVVEARNTEVVADKPATPTVIAPRVNLPNVMENFEDVDPLVAAEDVNRNVGMDISDIAENEMIEVSIAGPVRKREGFHYQFYDGKLFLFGDFKDQPYEIIELNTDEGRRLFLNYNNAYFVINSNQVEIAPLSVIQDSALIHELVILKENK